MIYEIILRVLYYTMYNHKTLISVAKSKLLYRSKFQELCSLRCWLYIVQPVTISWDRTDIISFTWQEMFCFVSKADVVSSLYCFAKSHCCSSSHCCHRSQ